MIWDLPLTVLRDKTDKKINLKKKQIQLNFTSQKKRLRPVPNETRQQVDKKEIKNMQNLKFDSIVG